MERRLSTTGMRKAFSDTLLKAAEANPRIVFLTGDLGFQVFDEFRNRFGPRYINVGIAEAQMVCAAAGLALTGWRPIVYSIASFATGRAFEQIRISISYPHLPVLIVGAGGGYTYAKSGVTHHAVEDFGLMSLLPGMAVVAPGDANEMVQLLPQLLEQSGPCYLRIGRYGEPTFTARAPAVFGRARLLQEGERVAVFCCGDLAVSTMNALSVLANDSIKPAAYQIHTIKPMDSETLADAARRVSTFIVVEEHLPVGGLWTAVNQWAAVQSRPPRLVRLGPPDALALGNPERDTLRAQLHYDSRSIEQACRMAWNESISLS